MLAVGAGFPWRAHGQISFLHHDRAIIYRCIRTGGLKVSRWQWICLMGIGGGRMGSGWLARAVRTFPIPLNLPLAPDVGLFAKRSAMTAGLVKGFFQTMCL